ncbi:MAG: response regulator transcription factor [Anaerolineales bacterium]|nr:response regulator transcription factor [Anaerolineales bacterium]
MKTKILLADDQPEVRSALKFLLEQESPCEVVGESSDAEELIKAIQLACPDVVLLDWELPNLQTTACMKVLRDACPGMKVVALSSQIESRDGALKSNVDAFVSKGDPPETVLDTLHALIGFPQGELEKGKGEG